jgi:Predicted metal-binding, possibly nucleic acid-binding protein
MATRGFDPSRLDVAAFAAAGGELAGEMPMHAMPRLASATLAPDDGALRAEIRWRAVGERHLLPGAGLQPSLVVEATTEVRLECQRCLQPMRLSLHAERRIFFVEGEDAAAALDAEIDDDVLALEAALDLRGLIEDELLLALPLVPRHEVCPTPLPRALVDDDSAVAPTDNPFAVLAALKQDSRPN